MRVQQAVVPPVGSLVQRCSHAMRAALGRKRRPLQPLARPARARGPARGTDSQSMGMRSACCTAAAACCRRWPAGWRPRRALQPRSARSAPSWAWAAGMHGECLDHAGGRGSLSGVREGTGRKHTVLSDMPARHIHCAAQAQADPGHRWHRPASTQRSSTCGPATSDRGPGQPSRGSPGRTVVGSMQAWHVSLSLCAGGLLLRSLLTGLRGWRPPALVQPLVIHAYRTGLGGGCLALRGSPSGLRGGQSGLRGQPAAHLQQRVAGAAQQAERSPLLHGQCRLLVREDDQAQRRVVRRAACGLARPACQWARL
jgi:hypothetical protein